MNSLLLTNINSFIKKRLIELSGVILIFLGLLLLAIFITYYPKDPNFIYSPEDYEIRNIGGFYGSAISDFFLQSLGITSIFFSLNFFSWGYLLISKKVIKGFLFKFFFSFAYLILGSVFFSYFYNDSFLLIDNGNGGFVGRIIKENIYYFIPTVSDIYIIYTLLALTIIFLYLV